MLEEREKRSRKNKKKRVKYYKLKEIVANKRTQALSNEIS